MKIVLLGPQGGGKGTQAAFLTTDFEIPHISTGEMFRQNIAEQTPLGLKVKRLIEEGTLIPDSITVQMLLSRIKAPDARKGFILDGYPRTLNQAVELNTSMPIDIVIEIEIDEDVAIERLLGRYACKKCGANFNVQLGQVEKCTTCGGELEQRSDDTEESIRRRLAQYRKHSAEILDFYRKRDQLISVKATAGVLPKQLYAQIKEQLSKKGY